MPLLNISVTGYNNVFFSLVDMETSQLRIQLSVKMRALTFFNLLIYQKRVTLDLLLYPNHIYQLKKY